LQLAQITGPLSARRLWLRELVERAFQGRLAELGCQVSRDLLTDHHQAGRFWYRQISWLKAGHAAAARPIRRAQVCKTGWSAFSTWAYHPYAEARALAGRRRRRQTHTHHRTEATDHAQPQPC
jgi:soluble lytic murein transglycosylase-like protein